MLCELDDLEHLYSALIVAPPAIYSLGSRQKANTFICVVEVTPGQGPIWLRMPGPAGMKEALQAAYPQELRQPAISKGDTSVQQP